MHPRFLWLLFASLGFCRLTTAEDSLVLTCPKPEVILHEPVYLTLKADLAHEAKSIRLRIDGKDVETDPEILGTAGMYGEKMLLDADVARNRLTAFYTFQYDSVAEDFLFRHPGTYSLQIRETGSALASNPVTLTVRAVPESEQEPFRIISEKGDVAFLHRNLADDLENPSGVEIPDGLRRLVKDYPGSAYAPHVAARLLLLEMASAVREMQEKPETARQIKARLVAFDTTYAAAARVPSPSWSHAMSLHLLASVKFLRWSTNLLGPRKPADEALAMIEEFKTVYADTPLVNLVDAVLAQAQVEEFDARPTVATVEDVAGDPDYKPPTPPPSRLRTVEPWKEPEMKSAVLYGLRWLARHQAENGSWAVEAFSSECHRVVNEGGKCEGPGHEAYDAGVTSLALLAFLEAGYSHLSKDTFDGIRFGDVIKRTIQWLTCFQSPEGLIQGRSQKKPLFNHCLATLALAEAYRVTESPLFKDYSQKAVDYLLQARNPGAAWRYTSRSGDNDAAVTIWALFALRSAKRGGLRVDEAAFRESMAWLEKVTGPDRRVGYTQSGTGKVYLPGSEAFAPHEALTAGTVALQSLFREGPPSFPLTELLLINADRPSPAAGSRDYLYWCYGTLALALIEERKGDLWNEWSGPLKKAVIVEQKTRKDGCANGSWDANDRWSAAGGRVYATAINSLTLEIYYGYENGFWTRD